MSSDTHAFDVVRVLAADRCCCVDGIEMKLLLGL